MNDDTLSLINGLDIRHGIWQSLSSVHEVLFLPGFQILPYILQLQK